MFVVFLTTMGINRPLLSRFMVSDLFFVTIINHAWQIRKAILLLERGVILILSRKRGYENIESVKKKGLRNSFQLS